MSRRLDISVGEDSIPAFYDLRGGSWLFRADAKSYEFKADEMPFTLLDYTADKALVLKHGR